MHINTWVNALQSKLKPEHQNFSCAATGVGKQDGVICLNMGSEHQGWGERD